VSNLSGAEGSRRVAQIVVSLVEGLRAYISEYIPVLPVSISVTGDVPVTTDPAVAYEIFRVAMLAASGELFSQTFSSMISALALPVTYVGTITYTTTYIPVATTTTVTAPYIPVLFTLQTLTVTTTQTVTTTYTQTVPTTLTTTITRTSVESIAAGAVIAIIGLAAGLLLRRK